MPPGTANGAAVNRKTQRFLLAASRPRSSKSHSSKRGNAHRDQCHQVHRRANAFHLRRNHFRIRIAAQHRDTAVVQPPGARSVQSGKSLSGTFGSAHRPASATNENGIPG